MRSPTRPETPSRRSVFPAGGVLAQSSAIEMVALSASCFPRPSGHAPKRVVPFEAHVAGLQRRGQVLVSELGSGRRSVGELVDFSRGGIRLALPHGLPQDEAVQIVFPRKSNDTRPAGRTIIGHVVQSKPDLGRHIVRIAFGWDAVGGGESRPVRKDTKTPSFFQPLSAKVRALVASAWNGR